MNLKVESGTRQAPCSLLVVDPTPTDSTFVVTAVSVLGLDVATAETFAQARAHMARRPPDVLVTAVKLGEYNGLHLVLRGKAERPDMTAIVTCPDRDPVLAAEAEAMGATFVELPTSAEEIRAALLRTLLGTSPQPVRPPFERRRTDRRGPRSTAFEGVERRVCESDRRRDLPMSASVPMPG